MVFFSEEKASFLQTLTIERVCILEYLAHTLDGDVLGEDLFAALLERRYVKAIGQL